jgi:NAD(P)-dependent dehydrogenase (short-subunit alcohol dehydrogenase family)
VTGGASGIGEAIVRALHGQATHVGFIDLQRERGVALAAELDHDDARVVFAPCDLTDIDALREAMAALHGTLGPAGILVNNAANDQREAFEDVSVEAYDRLMQVNLRHVFFAAQIVVPQMRSLGGGSIINMSSGAAIGGHMDLPSYSAAKGAILSLTWSLARKLGPSDAIRVNAVVPGAVRTERQMALWQTPQSQAAIVEQQCLRRDLLAEDVAQAVLFLASDQSAMITKQMLVVNGGLR